MWLHNNVFAKEQAIDLPQSERRTIEQTKYLIDIVRRYFMSSTHNVASRLFAVSALTTFSLATIATIADAQPYGPGGGGSGNMMGGGAGGGWGWGMGYGMGGVGGIGVVVLALVVLGIAVMAFRRRSS